MWVESAARFASHSAARLAALALNHLLDQHAWARDRLAPYAGRSINYRSPPLPDYGLVILDSGRVAPLRFGSRLHSLPLIGARQLTPSRHASYKSSQKHHVNSAAWEAASLGTLCAVPSVA